MALIPMILDEITTQEYNSPAMSYTAGTIGTYGTAGTVDVSKAGYTPIAATLSNVSGGGSGQASILLLGNTLYFLVYRTSTAAISISAANWKARVVYQRDA